MSQILKRIIKNNGFVAQIIIVGSVILAVGILGGLVFSGANKVLAVANPAATYCVNQGYKDIIVTAADGSQSGVCVFNDGSQCGDWEYYSGKCANISEMCGGYAGISCRAGLTCSYLDSKGISTGLNIPPYPDASGVCVSATKPVPAPPIYCTDDVKQCPDGSYVGRDSNCQFRACPGSSTVTCTDSDGGMNYETSGSVVMSNLPNNRYIDSCSVENGVATLAETYCSNNQQKTTAYVCPNGCGNGACLPGATITPSITVFSPNGGENFTEGSTQTITWNSVGVDKVNIYLKNLQTFVSSGQPSLSISTIASNISASSNQYSWQVPFGTAGTDRQIVISQTDGSISGSSKSSFTISATPSCDQKCKTSGYDVGTCKSFSITPDGFIQAEEFGKNNINVGNTSDCFVRQGVMGINRGCYCPITKSPLYSTCDSAAQAVVDSVGGCTNIDQSQYSNIYNVCCTSVVVTKETLLQMLNDDLADGVISDAEKTDLLTALNAYLQ